MLDTVLIILIFLDCLLYGFGSAIQNLNHTDLDKKKDEGNKKAERLLKIVDNPEKFVNTLQLITSVISMAIGVFMVRSFAKWIHVKMENDAPLFLYLSFFLSIAVLLYLLLTIGILTPKMLAARYPEKWAYFLVNVVFFTTIIFTPLTSLISASTRIVVRLFGVNPNASADDVTEEEIISMVNEGHEQGVLEASEAEMITNIFEFADKEAKDIMTHRENIAAIEVQTTLEDAMKFMLDGKNSRYPVYEESIDNIIGILHFKDAVKANIYQKNRSKSICDIEGLVKEANFIPETRNINTLFGSMQQNKIHIMIVVDEYGQTAGLVAMEDILEEIVGNILDEYDEEENHINIQEDDTYVMDGLTTLDEVKEQLGIEFEDDFETLNGFLTARLGRIPEYGDDFETEYQGYRFKILHVENKVIQSVRCKRMTDIEIAQKEETEG